jgi:hypothetical protein
VVAAPEAAEPAPSDGRWRRVAWRLLTVIAVAAVTFGLFWCYQLQSRTQGADSDSASQVLQGWDMFHGNPLLRGWFVSDVSFYTFEVPVDGLIATVYGLHTDVTHVAAGIEYALLVLFAALLAAGKARDRRLGGREGLVRALLAAGVIVAPGTWQGVSVLLEAPDHIGIGVPVLITLLVVDRVRPRRRLPAAATVLLIGVLLVWAQLDDPVATLGCALPLALVCAAPLAAAAARRLADRIRRRRGRPVTPPLPWRGEAARHGYDLALVVAAVASYGLTELAVQAISHAGGFYLHAIPAGSQISGLASVPAQVRAVAENLLLLFGANFWVRSQPQNAFSYLHFVGAVAALLGLLIAIWRWRRVDRVTRALVVGVLIMLAAGAVSPLMIPVGGAHEIAVVLPFGAVLGGRVIGPWLAGRRRPVAAAPGQAAPAQAAPAQAAPAQAAPVQAGTDRAWSGWSPRADRAVRVATACVLVVAGLGYLSDLGYAAAQRSTGPKYAPLADWLLAHKLTSGLSGYWEANITTLVTGGKVHLAPLISGGRYGYLWEAKRSWFNPADSSANFIVTLTQRTPYSDVFLSQLAGWYGKPAKIYQFEQFSIAVYHRNLLRTVIQPVPGDLYAPQGKDD